MVSQGSGAALSIIAGFLMLVSIGCIEVYAVPGLLERFVFHGDPSAGLGLGFLVIWAAIILIPVDIGAAWLFGRWLYKALRR